MTKKAIFENATNVFFNDRWKEKALEEGGKINHHKTPKIKGETENEISEIKDNEAINIYLEMTGAIGDDNEFKPMLADLERAIINYASVTSNFKRSRAEMVSGNELAKGDAEESDLNKRLAHNKLIDNLSALSRAYVKKYGKNMWRYKIDEGSGNRDRIANWAKAVTPFIEKKLNDL